MQDCLIQLLQLMQFWKNESFSLKLTNTIIGSDVKINQDFIHGYMGLDFDMSNFNDNGSDDVYTFGINMPTHIVQYHDSFELIWSWGRRSMAMAGEVTRHGRAHPYSRAITIVSLRSKESEG
jgi:hypothetical protein